MSKINVLQLCHNNAGAFIPVCKQYLAAFPPEKYQVHTVFLRGQENAEHIETLKGSRVHFLDLPGSAIKGLKLGLVKKMAAFCRQHRIRTIVAHRYKSMYVAGLINYLIPEIQVWGVAHTQGVFSRATRQLFVRYIAKEIQLVGVSKSVTRDISKDCPFLVGAKRIHTLANSLDESQEQSLLNTGDARQFLKLPERDYIIGSIGRLVNVKAHDVLLHAFAEANMPNQCRLLIIGDGPNYAKLKKLGEQLNISEQLVLPGQIDNAANLLRAFDSFVFASYEGEAFGLAMLEAMIARVPVICSDASGPLEVAGDTPFVFQQGNASELAQQLKTVYQLQMEQRKTLTDAAYARWQKHFSTQAFANRSSALFDS